MSTTYDLFARKEHPEPLVYIGSVEVESTEEIVPASLKQYGPESDWLEMIAVPHQQVIVVFSEKEAARL
ncbi:MAG TPA: hypothetical protein VEC96_01370 [Anaerolineae bacterium]|nr:hypothetical protein [Anaerolineae bacterium]